MRNTLFVAVNSLFLGMIQLRKVSCGRRLRVVRDVGLRRVGHGLSLKVINIINKMYLF